MLPRFGRCWTGGSPTNVAGGGRSGAVVSSLLAAGGLVPPPPPPAPPPDGAVPTPAPVLAASPLSDGAERGDRGSGPGSDMLQAHDRCWSPEATRRPGAERPLSCLTPALRCAAHVPYTSFDPFWSLTRLSKPFCTRIEPYSDASFPLESLGGRPETLATSVTPAGAFFPHCSSGYSRCLSCYSHSSPRRGSIPGCRL